MTQLRSGGGYEATDGNGVRLDSWKAIARYLSRDIRSVQRWERERGLPIHRVPGEKGGAVFAYRGELDLWLVSGASGASGPGNAEHSLAGNHRGEDNPSGASGSARNDDRRRVILIWCGAVAIVCVAAGLVIIASRKHARPGPPARSIAVLPLRNLSGNPGQDYLVDGLTEEITTEIMRLGPLRVISPSSTKPYKGSRKSAQEIARELGVALVLQGSVTREGSRVRVTSQLIDAASGSYLAARTDEGDLQDLLDFERRIARDIASGVRLQLSPGAQARLESVAAIDAEALDLYLQGRYQFAQQSPDSIRQSLVLYRAAVARAPSFARAYVAIAEAEAAMLQITAETPEESARRETQALNQALAIDPHLGDAHGLLASLYYWRDWDWPQAERQFRLALAEGALAPTEQRFGAALITRGRFREGMAHLQSALELDPLGQSPRVNQFFAYYFQRDFAAARRVLGVVLGRNPDFLAGHALMGLVATVEKDCPAAEGQAQWTRVHYPSPLADFLAALASGCRGDHANARRALERARGSSGRPVPSPYQLALGYALIHDPGAALAYLEKSADAREPQILYLRFEPLLDPIRSDARFIALEKRVRLL